MGKVSIQSPKTSGKSTTSSSSPKVPKASDLTDAKVGKTKDGKDKNKDKTIHINEVFFADEGGVYGDEFEDNELVALHLEHEYPNVWFLILRGLKMYCEFRRSTEQSFPGTLQELCRALKMKVVTTAAAQGKTQVEDEDQVGTFIKNRVAIYCNRTEVKKICCFLDEYVAWRVVTPLSDNDPEYDESPKITIHVLQDSELSFDSEDELECEVNVIKDVDSREVSAVQAYPPSWPPRFVHATVTSESETTISIVFSGNTLPFARGFDSLGIGKKAINRKRGQFMEWYRVTRAIDLSSEEKRQWALSIFGNVVLKNSPCFLKIASFPKQDADWKLFLKEVKQFRNVHVRS